MRKWISFVTATVLVIGAGCKGEQDEVSGEEGKKLALTAPRDTSIKQGDTTKITVEVKRTKFDGPVDLDFSQLPDGVRIEESNRRLESGDTKATFTLKADGDAKPKQGHKAKVSASGGGMKIGPLEFGLDVKEKK